MMKSQLMRAIELRLHGEINASDHKQETREDKILDILADLCAFVGYCPHDAKDEAETKAISEGVPASITRKIAADKLLEAPQAKVLK